MVYNMIVDEMNVILKLQILTLNMKNEHYKGAEFIITLPL